MYGISFELNLEVLKKEYGNSYHCAYEEVRHELGNVGFEWTHGSVYINKSNENSLTTVYRQSVDYQRLNGSEIVFVILELLK